MSVTTRMSVAVGKHGGVLFGIGSSNLLKNMVARIRGKPKHVSISTTTIIINEPLTKTTQTDGIRKIIMNSQKTRNCLSLKMMEDLIDGITCNQNDPGLRCILLYGEGRVFSSGHNLKELTNNEGAEYHHQIFATCTRLMINILQCPVPVIAVVQGLAAAAGCQLVASCDIAVCTDNSSFSTPGANFGIFCSTPGIAVARAVPRKVAAHMLFTGLPLSAEEALQAGLVSKVVAQEDLEEEVKKITDAICSKSRSVLEVGKKFLYQQMESDLKTAYRMGEEVMVNNLTMVDGQEGIRSFMEKRKPIWTHGFEKCH